MVRIPYIKIPSVRVGSIVPTSNIGTGGATPAPPTPITFLTQWQIVGNSEVHTLPYPDIPQGYTKCKYLEFHGAEYIDTGIIPEQGIGVAMKFKYIAEVGDDGIFGSRDNELTETNFNCFRQKRSQKFFAYYGTDRLCDGGTTGNFVINANDEIEFQLNSTSLSFTNGTDTFTKSVSSQITKGVKNVYIGRINGYGNAAKILLRTFILTDSVGNTIFNGIPCLDDNDVPCLYDTVSGTSFYNDGTGTFGYEIEPQPTEIWSCGEYNATDGKYHILVQPQGGSITDIALDEPLRKDNNITDTIEFPSGTEGKALVTRNILSYLLEDLKWTKHGTEDRYYSNISALNCVLPTGGLIVPIILCNKYTTVCFNDRLTNDKQITAIRSNADYVSIMDSDLTSGSNIQGEILLQLATPTTELVDAPQIAEAESYSMVISQGGKAVEWSSFETDSE